MGANPRLFRWRHASEWIAESRSCMLEVAGDDVFERFRAHPPGANPAYDVSVCLPKIFNASSAVTPSVLVQTLAHRFNTRFDAVRAFHAGRPVDPSSYLEQGLLLASSARLIEEARTIFCGPSPPCTTPEQLEQVVSGHDLSHVDGRLGLYFDARFLEESFTFYALYGSHFLLSLAVQLQEATEVDYKPLLRTRGKPTMLVCDVPVAMIPAPYIEHLCAMTIREALDDSSDPCTPPGVIHLGFNIHQRLSPNCVVDHYFLYDLEDSLYTPTDK